MSDPRAFISFDFDNNENSRMLFVGQVKNSRTPFNIQDWSSKERLPQRTWEETIEDKISRCHLVIILVGRDTYRATGVVKEIAMAQSKNVPYFGVYVDGAGTSTALPSGLARNRVISWSWGNISQAVSQMMGEGKNK